MEINKKKGIYANYIRQKINASILNDKKIVNRIFERKMLNKTI